MTSQPVVRQLLLWVVPLLVTAVAVYVYGSGGEFISTDNAYVIRDHVDITPEVGGITKQVFVHENQQVTAGTTLVELDAALEQIALEAAQAKLNAVRADMRALKAAVIEKNAEMVVAERAAGYAERDYQRQQELAARKLTAQVTVDSAHRLADISTGSIEVLKLQKAQLLAKIGSDPNVAIDQMPAVLAALAEVNHAQYQLTHTRIIAPQDGIVSHLPKLGTRLEAGRPALVIVSNAPAEIEANFKETDLEWVRVGQPVEIEIDTYSHRVLTGTVKSVAAATGAAFSLLPPQNASGNWVKVVQRIPVRIALNGAANLPLLRDGMSAEVSIDTGKHNRFERWFTRSKS
jgi:membrane fusion protein, multidrug efflux system